MKVLRTALVLALGFIAIEVAPTGQEPFFEVQPESVVQAEGLVAVFECQYPGATSYSWLINGIPIPLPPPHGLIVTLPSEGSPTARLIIPAITKYNNTIVQCQALVMIGASLEITLSNNATLQVQGPLSLGSQVRNHQISSQSITITWDPPFSLNLTTTAEPDIQYCVDVYNVTGGGDDHLQSVCDITETYYTFTASNPDQLFNFTVTPRSNVEGSLNGTTSEPIQGHTCLGDVPCCIFDISGGGGLDPVLA